MRMRVVLAVLMALLLPPGSRAAQFLDPGPWAAALTDPEVVRNATLLPFPAHSVVLQDGFGFWLPGQESMPVHVGPQYYGIEYATRLKSPPPTDAGQWSAAFNCNPMVFPCLGINRAIYVLPFPIIGVVGTLDYMTLAGSGFRALAIDFFDNAAIAARGGRRYEGFFAAIFDAPTSILDIAATFPNSDDGVGFTLRNAQVLVGTLVPEPAALALFVAGALGLAAVGRPRRGGQTGIAATAGR